MGAMAFFSLVVLAILMAAIRGNDPDEIARRETRIRGKSIAMLLGLGSIFMSLPLLGGCFGQQDAQEEVEDLTVQEIPVDPEETAAAEVDENGVVPIEEGSELFKEAMLPGIPEAVKIAQQDLIESTDPNERVKEIQAERADPYAYVPIPPPVQPPPPAPETTTSPNDATSDLPQVGDNTGNTPQGNNGADGNGSSPDDLPAADGPLPVLPSPTVTASQVEISGVANIGGEDYAIVKAPGEPGSRYVKEGDLLSNGVVLVKRIENGPGINSPVVVLEERGEEIALPVGANTETPEESTATVPEPSASVAALPVLP